MHALSNIAPYPWLYELLSSLRSHVPLEYIWILNFLETPFLTPLHFILIFIVSTFVAWIWSIILSHWAPPASPKLKVKLPLGQEYKMTFVIRTDLSMTPGKIAAQCAHAVLANYKAIKKLPEGPAILAAWETAGQPKITLRVNSEEELLALRRKAREANLVAEYIRDAGRTQISPGSVTVCCIGPGPKEVVDSVTGGLKLF